MYTFKLKHISFAATLPGILCLLASSCISNDLPYPWIMPTFKSFNPVAQDEQGHDLLTAPTEIDSVKRTVKIHLSEWANPEAVDLETYTLSDNTTLQDPAALNSPLNLTEPISLGLNLYYRTFIWTISAERSVNRIFKVQSQIGNALIDDKTHTISAKVPTKQSLDNLLVRNIKLGGPSSVMTPDLNDQTVDFTNPVEVNVEEFGKTTTWTITVVQTDVSIDVSKIDAWGEVAWVYINSEANRALNIEYRQAEEEEEWKQAPEQWTTANGGLYTACLRNLTSQTTYQVRAIYGDETSAEETFTTEATLQLPNASFTHWWLDDKIWNPNEQGPADNDFWGSGNRGATIMGQSNTTPITAPGSNDVYEGASLLSKYIGKNPLGKFAAGNIFAGYYVGTDGTDGILSMGRPFAAHPTSVTARIAYEPVAISSASKDNPNLQYMLGEPDTCIVWCALTTRTFEIRTKKSNRQLFDRNDPDVIAYGEICIGKSTDGFIDVTVPLNYVSTDRMPTHILLTSSASKYGDYFTGGDGSLLKLTQYTLNYNY